MRRYTTPTIPLTVTGADLTHCRVWATLSQGRSRRITRELTGTGQMRNTTTWDFEITLTQAESARFHEDEPMYAQVNVVDQNGFRAATQIVEVQEVDPNTLERTL